MLLDAESCLAELLTALVDTCKNMFCARGPSHKNTKMRYNICCFKLCLFCTYVNRFVQMNRRAWYSNTYQSSILHNLQINQDTVQEIHTIVILIITILITAIHSIYQLLFGCHSKFLLITQMALNAMQTL